uniref:Helicase ATP-binding domain-containing protein n=1 Tax=Glossina austeni TaxID=7395 RepID=A0A1A9VW68_GLOAU
MRYQRQALEWMYCREKEDPKGGILADDMGLGKTLTMIALILARKPTERIEAANDDEDDEGNGCEWSLKLKYYPGGTLIICPASLLRQWEFEIKSKVSGNQLTTCIHHGQKRESKRKLLRTYNIVITTYTIVNNEYKVNGPLFGIEWKRIVLDEGHIIRNHKSQTSVAVCSLRGLCRWVLTGTPVHNKQMDVYTLLKFLQYPQLDAPTYWKRCVGKDQLHLNTILKTLMLRRTKAQLQDMGELSNLPQKRTELIEIELDKDERKVYQRVMDYTHEVFAKFLKQKAESYEIFVLLLRLRQICCHPGLIVSMLQNGDGPQISFESEASDSEFDDVQQMSSESEAMKSEFDLLNKLVTDDNSETVRDILSNSAHGDWDASSISKASTKVLKQSNSVFDLKRPSSKMRKALEILTTSVLKTNDKAIVVSQWISVLEILGSHLEEAGISTLAFNGQIPVKKRQDIITEFNDPSSKKRILLLSLTAGGVGLNLIGANHLLLFDCHWNPQLEAQAQDRIYRVGQKKSVTIHKFVCKDTVEERIQSLQKRKLALADSVLSGGKGAKLTRDELEHLFGMDKR